jgi:hypothetical protein
MSFRVAGTPMPSRLRVGCQMTVEAELKIVPKTNKAVFENR